MRVVNATLPSPLVNLNHLSSSYAGSITPPPTTRLGRKWALVTRVGVLGVVEGCLGGRASTRVCTSSRLEVLMTRSCPSLAKPVQVGGYLWECASISIYTIYIPCTQNIHTLCTIHTRAYLMVLHFPPTPQPSLPPLLPLLRLYYPPLDFPPLDFPPLDFPPLHVLYFWVLCFWVFYVLTLAAVAGAPLCSLAAVSLVSHAAARHAVCGCVGVGVG